MQSLTEKFLFISRGADQVLKLFSQKIVSFHEYFVECLLLSGLGRPNESIDLLRMEKNPDFVDVFFQNVIHGLQSVEPLLISVFINDEKIDSYLSVFYLPFSGVEGFYLLQQVEGWDGSNNTSYQVWRMKDDCNLYDMSDHWNFKV